MRTICVLVFILTAYSKIVRAQTPAIDAYQVTQIQILASALDSIEFGWTLPINQDYDRFEVSFYQLEPRRNQSVSLAKNETSARLDGLSPGTTIILYVNTIKNSEIVGDVTYTATNKVADPSNVTIISIGLTGLLIQFAPPTGYYTGVAIVCYPQDETLSPEVNIASRGSTEIGCYFLSPGSDLVVGVFGYKGDINVDPATSNGVILFEKTPLSKSSLTFIDVSATEVNVDLAPPDGYFDSLTLELTLQATDSVNFYVDNTVSRPFCMINWKFQKTDLSAEDIKQPIAVTGLCPLSFWEAKVITVKEGFEPVFETAKYRNGYLNVDCSLVNLTTLGNNTTFYWPNSEMKVDVYFVSVSYSDGSALFESTFPFGTNSWTIDGLENNKEVVFNISVRNNNRNITSMACLKTLETGDPCPIYDENYEMDKYTAPYPDRIELSVPSQIFTSLVYIKDLKILVSTLKKCESEYDSSCYVSKILDVDEFKNGTSEKYYYVLPQQSNCFNKSCSLTFVLDQDYFFTLVGNGPCGRVVSNVVKINVPSPFPLATIVGSVVGASVFLVVVILGVIIVLTVKHIRKKHDEELSKLIIQSKYGNPDYPVLTSF